jgi:hypothetical protein
MAKTRVSGKKRAMPYLSAALICEKVLIEREGGPESVLGTVSAIRMQDSVAFPKKPAIKPRVVFDTGLALLIAFKSGYAKGKRILRVRLVGPSGKRLQVSAPIPLVFGDPPQGGHVVRLPAALKWEKEGLYWFEIIMDGVLCTRVPLRAVIVTRSQGQSPKPK